jgi:hypothetical protein
LRRVPLVTPLVAGSQAESTIDSTSKKPWHGVVSFRRKQKPISRLIIGSIEDESKENSREE